MSLEHKVVIVTGGAASIGKGIAECFAKESARIVIADCNEEDGMAAKAYLERMGCEVLFIKMDAAIEEDTERAVALTLEKWGQIDVLVNNVGTHLYKPLVDIKTQEWDYLMAVDLKGCFLMSRNVLPHMRSRNQGCIINISSVHANASSKHFTAYSAAKGGVVSMTRSMAAEYAADGIRVNAVLPGWTRSKTTDKDLSHYDEAERSSVLARWGRAIPIGRLAEPVEIGHSVVFLASDKASYITGACLSVDGGLSSTLIMNTDH
ncbi:SDR family NAD(P)-dependent oxidoreductase [Paenibacillus eucommiae]|uniref:Dihydroanticapsin dehydrogenase n=1 Tax=Paenibacillus eucommiae TaxID=1355755 RepID=A0ABS4IZH8_9BACL|nr:glucose 1-dehydrogenase [Paenibacillus eucommiae]MBP1992994.1 dihydroanticapsin dehydrogenase [Paenibacillus eucommiae]